METPDNSHHRISSIFNAIFLLFLSLLGFIAIGPFIGLMLAVPFTDASVLELEGILSDLGSSADGMTLLYFMQGGATFGMFILPALYSKFKLKERIIDYAPNNVVPLSILLAGAITIAFMGVNSIFIEWNANLHFPESLSDLEEWARNMEDRGEQMTKWMTSSFTDIPTLIAALFIMAVLPAIAEEYVFRGVVQREFFKGFNNIHVAIWLSAILFSAIHLQFFGFIPRLLLGALFGYLYFWSGNLLVPIFAHFVNNGFTLIMIYLNNTGMLNYDIQNSEAPSLASALIFAIITFGLIYIFLKQHQKTVNG